VDVWLRSRRILSDPLPAVSQTRNRPPARTTPQAEGPNDALAVRVGTESGAVRCWRTARRRERVPSGGRGGASRRRFALIGLRKAREAVFRACPALASTTLPIADALGCVLTEDVPAVDPVPPFANSAMDGYALRSADTVSAPVLLRLFGTTYAGDAQSQLLPRGAVQRVMTGAPIPPGADGVCMVEFTRQVDADTVEIGATVQPGENIRNAGADVEAGDVCARAGDTISPAHLGVLVSAGVKEVRVIVRPRVGVLSTGDELVPAGDPLDPGKIRDSNRPTLLARLRDDGFTPVDLGTALDETATIARAIESGARHCDAVITIGGVSVGEHDFLADALGKLGASPMASMRVAIRPAKPFAFGVLAEPSVPVFGLPGNPVSALVSYELIVRPALRSMSGRSALDRPLVRATAPDGLPRHRDERTVFARVQVRRGGDGTFEARTTLGQGSHQLRGLADADGLAVVPDGDGIPPGGSVDVLLLREDALVPGDDASWMP
jgi:molybdopterin molybdotransferase